jgi:predicted site-specific integrase-resolvase
MTEFIPSRKAARILGVHANTLRSWADSGKISHIVTESGQRKYDVSGLVVKGGRKICYARVSSQRQSADLERQIETLRAAYPDYEIVSDIGSGVNPKRKGIQTILELAMQRRIEVLVVTYKDRLSRNAFDFLEFIVKKAGGRVVVLFEKRIGTAEQELSEEMLAIIHSYSSKMYGRRRKNLREEDKTLPDTGAAEPAE